MKSVRDAFIWTFIVIFLLLAEGFSANAMACNYYASPNGGGNGLSPTSPFKIVNFWHFAGPGKTLCLLDGVYTDSIVPPQHLNGTASARITIKALNDGKVRLDGGGVRIPVQLRYNDYFLLEGFDAHNSKGDVFRFVTGADNNIARRVCAWDANPGSNNVVWQIDKNTGNLLEDVCGFGTGRKIYQGYQVDGLTIRRAWGRWEKSTVNGPKLTISAAYNSTNVTVENFIGTWHQDGMGGLSVNQPTGILGTGSQQSGITCSNTKYFGAIAYVRGSDVLHSIAGLFDGNNDAGCYLVKDTVLYIEPGTHSNLRRFNLHNDPYGVNKSLQNTTEIGGASSTIGSQWTVTGRVVADTVGAAPNVWNGEGSSGARICKRYVNGALTNTPLWPWPMNQRIIDAMRTAGKSPVDVKRTMEEIFGPIPSECRGDTASTSSSKTSPLPTPPSNLSAQ